MAVMLVIQRLSSGLSGTCKYASLHLMCTKQHPALDLSDCQDIGQLNITDDLNMSTSRTFTVAWKMAQHSSVTS